MSLIDRYLLRQFVRVLVLSFFSLYGLYVVGEFFANVDEFVRYAEQQQRSLLAVAAEYYAYRSVYLIDRTSGVLATWAATFTLAGFQRHHELTALLAAGITRVRVLRALVVGTIGVSVLAAANRELVVPAWRDRLALRPKELGNEALLEVRPRYDHATNVLLRGKQLVPAEGKILEPSFVLPPGLAAYGTQLSAAEALYVPASADHPAGYLLRGVAAGRGLAHRPSLALGGRPVLITPRDAAWLAPDECFVVSDVGLELLVGGQTWRDFASTRELLRGLANPSLDFGADVRVAVHSRLVQPLLDVTLFFLAVPLILGRENRNLFLAVGTIMAVVVAFLLVVLACQYLGNIYLLEPALAAWAPLLLFGPVAAALFDRLER
jgi:lipopolysaccharide export system permease protein